MSRAAASKRKHHRNSPGLRNTIYLEFCDILDHVVRVNTVTTAYKEIFYEKENIIITFNHNARSLHRRRMCG